jgi:hypothetical protein
MAARWKKVSSVDDMDFCEAVMGLEADFGVSYDQDAFRDCLTAGQAFDVLWAGLPSALTSGGKCPSQMAFYRLRAAIGRRDLKPGTRLGDIPGFSYVALQRVMRADGWNMPVRAWAAQTWCLSLLTSGSVLIGLYAYLGWAAWVVAAIVLWASIKLLHDKVFTSTGPYSQTLGELARRVTDCNTQTLLRKGASFSRRMIWERFVDDLGGDVVRESGFY